jgi:PAS domain S-box-containing protein
MMLRQIITYIILAMFIFLFANSINRTKNKIFSFLDIEDSTNKLIIINKNFDLFIKDNKQYDNFDLIETEIYKFNKIKKTIHNNILVEYKNLSLANSKNVLHISINKKIALLRKIKSYRAILNNSYRIINKLHKQGISIELNNLFINLLLSNTVNYINIQQELSNIESLKYRFNKKYDKYFLLHSKIIYDYQLKLIKVNKQIDNISLDKKLETFTNQFKTYSKKEIKQAQIYVFVLLVVLLILLVLHIINIREIKIANKKLSKFKLTLENSDSIVMITDKNEKITYVNEAFEKISKYTKEEVLGHKPSILQSNMQEKEFFIDIKNTIHSGNKWFGQFINKTKDGKIYYEKAIITPSFDDNGEIEEFICIKLDITKEIHTEQKLKDREKLLFEQSKLSAMGEMIGNIAHQWRQPLSVISAGSTGILLQNELNIIDSKFLEKTCTNINNNAQYLSDTIDDFTNFIKGDKNKEFFSLEDNMKKFLNLINPVIKDHNINLIVDFTKDIQLNSYSNELNQCLINIVNNSIHILKEEKEIQRKNIFLSTYSSNDMAIITIKDSANGIPTKYLKKIFEPYFTTKHKSVGTGLGLSMTHRIITKSLKGKIDVKNVSYIYNNIELQGAEFTIMLPLS